MIASTFEQSRRQDHLWKESERPQGRLRAAGRERLKITTVGNDKHELTTTFRSGAALRSQLKVEMFN